MLNKMHRLTIKKGFTLIELILVLTISSAVTFMSFNKFLRDHETTQANNAGEQLRQVGTAVNSYIAVKYDKLSSLSNSTGLSDDPGPRTCIVSTSTCSITIQTLINEGILPSTYKGINIFNSGYNITLKRNGTAPYYNINGLVATLKPWVGAGSVVRYDLLGQAMQLAGIDSGVTNNSTSIVSGYNGNWSQSNSSFNNINQAGQLAYQVGYGSFSYSIYLRRDGTLPMTGDLNLGTNNINNIKDINISGNATVLGNVNTKDLNATGNVNTKDINATGNSKVTGTTTTGYAVVQNSLTWGSFATKGTLDTFGNLNAASATLNNLQVTQNVNVAQQVTSKFLTGQFASLSGEVQSPKIIVSGGTAGQLFNSGTSYLDNIYMNPGGSLINYGTLYTGSNSTFNGDINAQKNVSVYGTMSVTQNLSASSNITAYGVIQGAYIYPSSTVVRGAACSPNGYISKDSSGAILSCSNAIWKEIGGDMTKVTGWFMTNTSSANGMSSSNCIVKNSVTNACSCSTGTVPVRAVINEGGSCGSGGSNCSTYTTAITGCN